MMKKIFAVFIFMLSLTAVKAQTKHRFKDQIKSKNWDLLAKVDFREASVNEMFPIYTAQLKEKNGKMFDLEGYMVPIDNGAKHQKFILSALPIGQCSFCGKNGTPILIMVEMDKAIDYSVKTVFISGLLKLSDRNIFEGMPISITQGKLISN